MTQFPYLDATPLDTMPKEMRDTLLALATQFVKDNDERMVINAVDEKNVNLREALELILTVLNQTKLENGVWKLVKPHQGAARPQQEKTNV